MQTRDSTKFPLPRNELTPLIIIILMDPIPLETILQVINNVILVIVIIVAIIKGKPLAALKP